MFTKEHYIKIADILRVSVRLGGGISRAMLVDNFTDFFKKDNPKFNYDMFIDRFHGKEGGK